MYYLYILKNKDSGKYYIGQTDNVERRLKQHLSGKSSFGKRNKNLQLLYKIGVSNRSEAKRLESFLKKQKSHQFINRFIAGKIVIPR